MAGTRSTSPTPSAWTAPSPPSPAPGEAFAPSIQEGHRGAHDPLSAAERRPRQRRSPTFAGGGPDPPGAVALFAVELHRHHPRHHLVAQRNRIRRHRHRRLRQRHHPRIPHPSPTMNTGSVEVSMAAIQKRAYENVGVRSSRQLSHIRLQTHASLLIDDGANVLAVAQRMGHTDPAITLRTYGHLFEGVQEQLTDRLEQRRQGRRDASRQACGS